ncbi:MAG: tetratricopeptide repeat protein [Spirochaetota bacterium]
MRRNLLSALSAPVTAAFLALFLAGCATSPPERDAPPAEEPAEQVPQTAPAEPEPVLTVPEAYDAISLSVQAGDPEAAIAAYEEAQLDDPDDPATRVLLANLFLIAGETDEAARVLDEVLADEPDNTDALYLLALVRGAEGDDDEQRRLLERILELDPTHVRARSALAELQVQGQSYRDAAENFRAALEQESDNLVARVGLGNVYLRQERYEEAEQELSAAIDLAPDYSFAYSDRARARALQYELGAAETDLSTAIELDPQFYWHYIDRGRVRLERRRFGGAEADFTRAIELNGERFLGFALRARARDAQEDVEGALADYERTLAMRPDYTPAFAPIGVLSYMTEAFDDAFSYLERAFEEEDRRYDLALLASLALKSARRDRESTDFLNGIVNTISRDSLYYDMMRYYLQPGNEGYVMSEIRASTDDTLKAQMYFYLGAQLELLGRIETAQASFLEAEEGLQPGFVERRLASWRLRAYRSGEEDPGE